MHLYTIWIYFANTLDLSCASYVAKWREEWLHQKYWKWLQAHNILFVKYFPYHTGYEIWVGIDQHAPILASKSGWHILLMLAFRLQTLSSCTTERFFDPIFYSWTLLSYSHLMRRHKQAERGSSIRQQDQISFTRVAETVWSYVLSFSVEKESLTLAKNIPIDTWLKYLLTFVTKNFWLQHKLNWRVCMF